MRDQRGNDRHDRFAKLLIGAGLVAGLLAAPAATAAGPAHRSAGPAAAQAAPKYGGTLRMLGVGDLDHIDSAAWYYTTDYELGNLITRQLMTYHRDTLHRVFGEAPVPDAASGQPHVSNGGKTYVFHIRKGVRWNTKPARQVTAADFIRGIARVCNPIAPFGAVNYFTTTIRGFKKFCDGEFRISGSAKSMRAYLHNHLHEVTGMRASGRRLTFHLIRRTSDFRNIVTLGSTSAVPVEYLKYRPDSAQLKKHLISDGPYRIDSYARYKSIRLSRNPAWRRSTDPNRHAYVDKIHVSENLQQEQVQQMLQAGSGDMEWDTFPLPTQVGALHAQHDPNLVLDRSTTSNPFLVLNTVARNAKGAMRKLKVRRAIAYAVYKPDLIQDLGGALINTRLDQILPTDLTGGKPAIHPYKHSVAKAKQLLHSAGFKHGVTLRLLYRYESSGSTKVAQTLKRELKKAGIHITLVGSSNEEYYGRYLQVQPSITRKGQWDIAITGWGADWTGNAARTYFQPLLDGRTFAPASSNFGDFRDKPLDRLIDRALVAKSVKAAGKLWRRADQRAMDRVPQIPITNPKTANYHATRVHNFIYWDNFQNGDATNVWLS